MADGIHIISKSSICFSTGGRNAIEHMCLSSTLVFQFSICSRVTVRYCHAIANASTLAATMTDLTLEEELQNLQHSLASQEMLYGPRKRNSGNGLEFLVVKKENLKFRIDPNLNHARPHFHVDYGHIFHAVSVCIDTGEILAGHLPSRQIKTIQAWAAKNKVTLVKIWNALRESKDPTTYLAELEGN